jgi:hypothetical protein
MARFGCHERAKKAGRYWRRDQLSLYTATRFSRINLVDLYYGLHHISSTIRVIDPIVSAAGCF